MRAGAAQPCQVRKEATVSGGLLRRDTPGKGAFVFYICFKNLLDKKIKKSYYFIWEDYYASKNNCKEDNSEEDHSKSESEKDNEEVK